MKTEINKKWIWPALALFAFLFISCGNKSAEELQPLKVTVYCDDAIIGVIKPLLEKHDSSVKEIEYDFKTDNAYKCMVALLSENADAAIISRDYSPVELEQFVTRNIEPKKNKSFAYDLLVLFAGASSVIDTLSYEQVSGIFAGNMNIRDIYPSLKAEPVISGRDQYSSEMENLKSIIARHQKMQRPLKVFSSIDSLKNYVAENNSVGVAFLSQLQNDERFKLIKIGYSDSTGKRILPQVVDRTTLIRNMYPYKVTHNIFLAKKNNSPADRLYRFLTINNVSAKYFVDAGVIPAYTKTFILKQEE